MNASLTEVDQFFNGTTASANITLTGTIQGNTLTDGTVSITGGNITAVTAITATTVNATTLDLGTNTISDLNFNGNWGFNSGNLSAIGTIGSGAITSTGAVQGTSITDGTATMTGGNLSAVGTIGSGAITSTGAVQGLSITDGVATMTLGAISGVTTLTATTLDLGTNTITDANFNGNWSFNSGNLSAVGTIGSGAITSTGAVQGSSLTDGTATITGGNITGVTAITATTVNATTLDLGTNTITDGNFNGVWNFNSGNLSAIGTIGSGAITSTGAVQGSSLTDGTATVSSGAISGVTTLTMSGNLTVDTNTLFVDSSGNRVGIGTASPNAASMLDIVSAARTQLHINGTVSGADGNFGDIFMANAGVDGILISGRRTGADNNASLTMFTTEAGSLSERIRIRHDGNVGIRTTNPTAQLHIDQPNVTAGIPVLKLDQGDLSEPFVDFLGAENADVVSSLSSLTTPGATQGFIQIDINGTKEWIQRFADPS